MCLIRMYFIMIIRNLCYKCNALFAFVSLMLKVQYAKMLFRTLFVVFIIESDSLDTCFLDSFEIVFAKSGGQTSIC